MKIKNLRCYALGAIILLNSSFMVSCDAVSNKNDEVNNKEFYDFLDENDIVSVTELRDTPRNYYEAEVSEHNKISDDYIQIRSHWERLERIDNVVCQAREFDYDYKVLKVTSEDGNFKIDSKVVEDIYDRPLDYDYVYENDYVISKGYRNVLLKYGKVLRRD